LREILSVVTRRSFAGRCLIASAALAGVSFLFAGAAGGAEPRPAKRPAAPVAAPPGAFPFADPQAMFEQFFGGDTADEAALAKVDLSLKEERQYGDAAAEAFRKQLEQEKKKVVSQGKEVKYLEKLVATLKPQLAHADRYRSLKVYLVETPHTDARCFPGGTIFVFRGLLEFSQSEAALIGILGHELSHVDRGHQTEQLKRMKLAQEAFGGGSGFSPEKFMAGGMSMMKMFARPFRPEAESEADLDGATWAYRAGYDIREMAALFLRLHERDKDGKEALPGFFRTHPFHIDRYRAILARYDELQQAEPNDHLYIGRPNLEKRVTKGEKEFAE
jgi:predicted Zn-dependent protease